jgi:hypothetical protein
MPITNPLSCSFTAPAQYTDGTAIPAGAIVKYQYGFGQVSKTYTIVVDDTDLTPSSGKQTGSLPNNLAFGNWFAAARSVTKDGAVSDWSNEVPFSVAPPIPQAITDFSVG